MSAYAEQMMVMTRQEEIQKGLEECGEDMDKMSALLDELQVHSNCPPVQRDNLIMSWPLLCDSSDEKHWLLQIMLICDQL